MTLFREHRGLLVDSMLTVREVNLGDLRAYVADVTGGEFHDVVVEPYGVDGKAFFDQRIGWNTYIVTAPGYGVLGFTNGPVE